MMKQIPMAIQHTDLNQAALEILNAADNAQSCQRLSAVLAAVFPAAHISLLLSDATSLRARLYLEDGAIVDEPGLSDARAASHALQRLRDIPLDAPGHFQEVVDAQRQLTLLLRIKGRLLGMVCVRQDASQGAFSEEQTQAAQFLADQAAAAVELARLYTAEQTRLQEEQALVQAGRKLSEDLKPEELPLRILEQLAGVVPYERDSLMLQEGDTLRIAAQRGFPTDERLPSLLMTVRQGDVYDQVASSAMPLLVDDVTLAPGWTQVEWLPLNRSWLGVPLFSKDRVAGMVSLTRREPGAFSQEDVLMAAAFAMQAAVALENAALYAEITRFNQQLELMVQQRTQELRQALHTVERMERNRSDFISVTAHELRTPLTVMMGYVGILQADAALQANPFMRQVVDGFVKGADRLADVVESMLELVRIDTQELKIEPGLVSLASVARRVALDYESYLKERRQTLELVGLESLPVVRGDPSLLLKVFQNIVINAIKYTPDGGTISISGLPTSLPDLGECVEIHIQDSGIGIDPDNQELIFEKLFSLGKVGLHSSGKFTFKGGGPGLGLAIARGIVQAHGGKLWVHSERADEQACPGSTFHILLPVNGPAALPPTA